MNERLWEAKCFNEYVYDNSKVFNNAIKAFTIHVTNLSSNSSKDSSDSSASEIP